MLFAVFLLVLLPVTIGGVPVNIIEGDIVVDQETKDTMDGKPHLGYDGMWRRKWPNGIIPYVFDYRFDYGRRRLVLEAIAEYKAKTCIQFVPRTNQVNYVNFMIGGGCYSSIGMTGRGRQDISIGNGCQIIGTVIHEMMHAAGFFHEQSRIDRDNYVVVYWNNIMQGMSYNFDKHAQGEADTFGEPYDYDSVMHYGKYAFSRNRGPTIVARGNPNRQLGQRRGFSQIDIKQLNKMYKCSGGPSDCADKHKHCPQWLGQGFCSNDLYKRWMSTNCCKSCKDNTGTTSNCKDDNKRCKYWSRIGECRKNPDYMLENCKMSCGQC